MKDDDFEGLYVDDEPYSEYMKRMLEESVQYKPKNEDSDLDKYYDYEVEKEKPKETVNWSEVILGIISYVVFVGVIIFSVIFMYYSGGE